MALSGSVSPSAPARQLFSKMVARGDDGEHISLEETVKLAVERHVAGQDPAAHKEIHELIDAEWIRPHPEGGWRLD